MNDQDLSPGHVLAAAQAFLDGFGSGRWTEVDVVLGAVADDAA